MGSVCLFSSLSCLFETSFLPTVAFFLSLSLFLSHSPPYPSPSPSPSPGCRGEGTCHLSLVLSLVFSFVLSFPARVSRLLNKEGFLFDRSMEMTRFSSLNLATPGQALGFSSLFLCSSSSRSIHTRHSFPLVFTKHSFLRLSFFVLLLLVSGLATSYT